MVFLSIGSTKRVKFELQDKSSQILTRRTIPVFFPLAFVFFIFQNYKILLTPFKLSKWIVAKITLINLFQFQFHPPAFSILKFLFIHILLIPKKCTFPIRLREHSSNGEVWVSRHAAIQGFEGGRFVSEHEDELKRFFFSKRIQVWGAIANQSNDPRIECLNVKSKIELLRIAQDDRVETGQIRFQIIPDALVVNGSYVVSRDKHVKTLPYDVGGASSFPQRDLMCIGDQTFQQQGLIRGNQHNGLFIGNSNNWYHFVMEVLPRGILWHRQTKHDLGVVFNRDVPNSIYRIIGKIGRKEPILIADGETLNFESLTVAIDGRHPHQADMHRIKPTDNIFANRLPDLSLIQSWMKEKFNSDEGASPKRVFLIRGVGKSRPLKNLIQLQSVLEGRGFVTVNPGTLSIEHQIHLFENAEIMVAEGGAALTNLIFSSKMKYLIHIEANPHPQVAGFWQQFAEVLNIEASSYLGEPDKGYRNFGEAYTINVENLIKQLDGFC